jgi:hypothetical protein
MNKFLIATLISLTPYNNITEAKSVVEIKPNVDPGCLTREVAVGVIEIGGYELLVRGTDPNKKTIEFWFNGKKEMVMVSYEIKDNKPESVKQVCILGFGENIIFNGDTVDLLKRALDKVNPKI